ncbi:hypothetical protein PR002_g2156 [Phytophthora rubi]|uniref:Uncharacterized protein n=1 Tax=Phytophthora rubi TaxID=129364 RepID=A0A6A3NQR5_9STRA|nr:hypothetical protein PR002_g2156 [Phytophthora rubi]
MLFRIQFGVALNHKGTIPALGLETVSDYIVGSKITRLLHSSGWAVLLAGFLSLLQDVLQISHLLETVTLESFFEGLIRKIPHKLPQVLLAFLARLPEVHTSTLRGEIQAVQER